MVQLSTSTPLRVLSKTVQRFQNKICKHLNQLRNIAYLSLGEKKKEEKKEEEEEEKVKQEDGDDQWTHWGFNSD